MTNPFCDYICINFGIWLVGSELNCHHKKTHSNQFSLVFFYGAQHSGFGNDRNDQRSRQYYIAMTLDNVAD